MIRQKPVGQEDFITFNLVGSVQDRQADCFVFCQPVCLGSKGWRQTNDRHSCLDGTGPLHHTIGLRGDSHGSAGDGSEGIDTACSVRCKGRARKVGELLNHVVDHAVIPFI